MSTLGRNNIKIPEKRIIALILAIISFVTLVFPLVQVSVEIAGRNYSLSEIVDRACRYDGMSRAQFLLELRSNISSSFSDVEEETGIRLDAKKAASTIEKILKGKASILDGAIICTNLSGVMKEINEALSANISELSYDERMVMLGLEDAGKACRAAAIVLWTMIAVLLVTFIFSIISLLRKKKTGTIAYLAASCLVLVGTLVFVGKLNSSILDYTSFIMNEIENVLSVLGGSRYTVLEQNLFHVTSAPYISLACAALAVLLTVIHSSKVSIPDVGFGTDTTKWECPGCGAKNKNKSLFCPYCGRERTKKAVHECGAPIVPGMKFCGKCGKPIDGVVGTTPKRCPQCGSIMDGEICRRCAARIQPTKKCVRCGAPINGENTYCESCAATLTNRGGDLWGKPGDTDLG